MLLVKLLWTRCNRRWRRAKWCNDRGRFLRGVMVCQRVIVDWCLLNGLVDLGLRNFIAPTVCTCRTRVSNFNVSLILLLQYPLVLLRCATQHSLDTLLPLCAFASRTAFLFYLCIWLGRLTSQIVVLGASWLLSSQFLWSSCWWWGLSEILILLFTIWIYYHRCLLGELSPTICRESCRRNLSKFGLLWRVDDDTTARSQLMLLLCRGGGWRLLLLKRHRILSPQWWICRWLLLKSRCCLITFLRLSHWWLVLHAVFLLLACSSVCNRLLCLLR